MNEVGATRDPLGLPRGQQYVWLEHYQAGRSERHEWNIALRLPPPPEATTGTIALTMNYLVGRYESLRTTYPLSDGHGPVRHVDLPAPLPAGHFEMNTAMRSLSEYAEEFIAAEFDLEKDWPIRVTVVTQGSVPRLVLLVFHHTAVDHFGVELFLQALYSVHSRMVRKQPIKSFQREPGPADLDRYEQSPQGVRANHSMLENWRRCAERMPAPSLRFRRSPVVGEAPVHGAALSMMIAPDLGRRLAAQYKVWPSVIFMAAFAALTASLTGTRALYYRFHMRNRELHWQRSLMSCLYQPALLHIDFEDDPPFSSVVRRAAEAYSRAQKLSYGAYDNAMEIFSRRSFSRGVPLRISADLNYLNDRSKTSGVKHGFLIQHPPPLPWSSSDEDLHFRLREWRDCVVATVYARSDVLDEGGLRDYLRAFESLLSLVEHDPPASDIARILGLTAPHHQRDSELRTFSGTPVSFDNVMKCLSSHPAVREVKVFDDVTPAGEQRLRCRVYSASPSLTPTDLRTHFLARMYRFPHVACPSLFTILDETGTVTRAEGDGRDGPEVSPQTKQETALADAVLRANSLDSLSMAHSYVMAGGRVMNIPRTQQLIRKQGWAPPTLFDMAGARPLSALAAELARE